MKYLRYFTLAAMATVLASCAKEQVFDPVAENPDLIPLNISGSIDQVATRATAEGFVNGDAVGLFAVNYSENNTIAGTLAAEGNQADNVKYVFDEPNYKWIPVKPVYYKDINTHVDLYLYYPYQGEISDVSAANFEVKKDQSTAATATALSGYEASDWMWGKATDITPTESKVQIPLSHKLSAIQVTLNEGTGWDQGEFEAQAKSVIVTNTTRKATLNYATGDVIPVGNPQLDGIVMCPQTDGTFRAIVIPQTVDAGASLFSITVNGISYSFTQNNPVTYQQSKQINVTININKKTPAGDFELELADAQIVPWTEDLNTHGGEARQYFVVNVETPGTLGDIIAAMEKNPARIRNLKIVGQINRDDLFFIREHCSIIEAVNMKECVIEDGVLTWCDIPSLCYYVFPESLEEIGSGCFRGSHLSGALVLPEGLRVIDYSAFQNTYISSLSLPSTLEIIGQEAFKDCSNLTGDLYLPEGIKTIRTLAFEKCSFNGQLHLPNSIEELDYGAFAESGSYVGDLVIPEKVTFLPERVFFNCGFTGKLDLNNVTGFSNGGYQFSYCRFNGELIIPEGVVSIPKWAFGDTFFSSVIFPSSLRTIEDNAFDYVPLMGQLDLNEGLISIGLWAFYRSKLTSIVFPSTLQTIRVNAFCDSFDISRIVCMATEPPTAQNGAFSGIGKDNLTVQVPSQSVTRYQTDPAWGEFKRISAHYDFSLSRRLMRALNESRSHTYVLRAPAGYTWSIENKPEWVTVEPSSGTGKTDVTITLSEMARTSDEFEVNEGQYNNPSFVNYHGRYGQIVFALDDKDCTFTFDIELKEGLELSLGKYYNVDTYLDGELTTIAGPKKQTKINLDTFLKH